VKIKLPPHLTAEVIEEIINVSIEYVSWIIVYLAVLLAILVGLKLLFNINLFNFVKKVLD
jgi:hypothetical protein